MKKLYALLVAGACSLGIAHAADKTPNLKGSGTEADPWLISSKADIKELDKLCNPIGADTAAHYKGCYFKLTADIDMTPVPGEYFYGIGGAPRRGASSNKYYFAGNFDGQGYRIKNMKIEGVAYDEIGAVVSGTGALQSRKWVGFFGRLDSTATVKNLIIDSSCSITALSDVGGIAGYMQPGTSIINCENYANITAFNSYAGGIAGESTSSGTKPAVTIQKCFNAGVIRVGVGYAGGIIGNASYTNISECANVGSVLAEQVYAAKAEGTQTYAGGIAGKFSYASIDNCVNAGDVIASKDFAGGITPECASLATNLVSVSNCVNYGTVYIKLIHLNWNKGQIISRPSTSLAYFPKVSNCYFDTQMVSNTLTSRGCTYDCYETLVGKSTTELTSGATLAGLGSEWSFAAGRYPVLKCFEAQMKEAASTYMNIPATQAAMFCKGSATLSSGTVATLSVNKGWTVSNNAITAGNLTEVMLDTVTLTNGSYTRKVLIGGFPSSLLNGEGTAAAPYKISNLTDMLNLQTITSSALCIDFEGQYLELINDVDMQNSKEFHGLCFKFIIGDGTSSIGRFNRQFRGTLDGKGYKFTNMLIDNVAFDADGKALGWNAGSAYFNGLFGSICGHGTVKNLTIDNTCEIRGLQYTGGICGWISDYGTIQNCHVAAKFLCYGRGDGGIAGTSGGFSPNPPYNGLIENCSFTGEMNACEGYVGGIIAHNYGGTIRNCVNTATIKCKTFNAVVKETATVNFVGGIVCSNGGVVENCANFGSVMYVKDGRVGGIVGQSTTGDRGFTTISKCFSVGQVKSEATECVGNTVGNVYLATGTTPTLQNNVFDKQLCYVDSANGGTIGQEGFYGYGTKPLTNGYPVAELGDSYVYEAGYYPIPKGLENIPGVRAAAATFITMPSAENIHAFRGATINNVMPLQASFETGTYFGINGLNIFTKVSPQNETDVLTLTNGGFYTYYPMAKLASVAVDGIEADENVYVEYFTTQGYRVLNPEKGALLIKVATKASGAKEVSKVVF